MPWIEAWAYLPSRAKGASTLDIAHVLHASRAIQGARGWPGSGAKAMAVVISQVAGRRPSKRCTS
jgi:hypothetical protein